MKKRGRKCENCGQGGAIGRLVDPMDPALDLLAADLCSTCAMKIKEGRPWEKRLHFQKRGSGTKPSQQGPPTE